MKTPDEPREIDPREDKIVLSRCSGCGNYGDALRDPGRVNGSSFTCMKCVIELSRKLREACEKERKTITNKH